MTIQGGCGTSRQQASPVRLVPDPDPGCSDAATLCHLHYLVCKPANVDSVPSQHVPFSSASAGLSQPQWFGGACMPAVKLREQVHSQ